MSEFRTLIACIFLTLFVTTLAPVYADRDHDEDPDARLSSRISHIEDHDEQWQSITERNKERIKKLQKKIQKAAKKIQKNLHQTGTILPVKTPVVVPKNTSNSSGSTAITHTSSVTYRTPAGSDPIGFTVTVQSGVITAASSTVWAKNGTSAWYQESFGSTLSQAVVGKKIAGLSLSAIGGASLTTRAFEQFVKNSF